MKTTNTDITVNLDSKSAIEYLKSIGFQDDFKDEASIKKAFIASSNDYLNKKIDTLIYCSVINLLFYTYIMGNQINIIDNNLYSLLSELSELQYYHLISDSERIEACLSNLRQYLSIKNESD